MIMFSIEWFLFDLQMKTGEPNTNRVSGVLISSANTPRTCVLTDWILEHVRLTPSSDLDLDLSREQSSVHS